MYDPETGTFLGKPSKKRKQKRPPTARFNAEECAVLLMGMQLLTAPDQMMRENRGELFYLRCVSIVQRLEDRIEKDDGRLEEEEPLPARKLLDGLEISNLKEQQ